MRVTVLGTGAMGAGMAQSLLRAGIEVTVWNRTAERARPLADDGATVATGVAEAVAGADVVVAMLFDADSVLAVMAEALPAMAPGAVFVQSSTVGVEGAARTAAMAAEHDAAFLDCPVVGTKGPAEQGKLVLLPSGDPGLRERVQPAFDAMGAKTVWVGSELGRGSALKLVCNAWIGALTAAVGQSLAFAKGLELDQQLFLDVMGGGAADSPYLQLKGRAVIDGDFTPQFAVDGVRKDTTLIRAALQAADVSPVLAEAVQSVFDAASQAGHGDDDMAAAYFAF